MLPDNAITHDNAAEAIYAIHSTAPAMYSTNKKQILFVEYLVRRELLEIIEVFCRASFGRISESKTAQ